MKIKLQVTDDDIDQGICEDSEKCPVALALYRAINNEIATVHVEDGAPEFYLANGTYKSDGFHKIINDFILAFDQHEEVKPFELDMEFDCVDEFRDWDEQ